jgi:uncharacterized membrane protein
MKNAANSSEYLDNKIEIILGNLLRAGVIISGSIAIIGAVVFFIRHGYQVPDYHDFIYDPFSLTKLGSIFREIFDFKSIAIIKLGILFLIATPVLRVVFSVIAFLYEKDYLYVLFTLIVLAVLIFSLFY